MTATRSSVLVGVLLAAACTAAPEAVTSVTAAAAGNEPLEGTVRGGGVGLPGATVEALDGGTSTVAGFTTTNVDGGFRLTLAAGTYDVRITSAGDARFPAQLVRGIVVPAGGALHDFVLVAPAVAVTGAVRGTAGATVPGANVTVDDLATGEVLATTTTDATGAYAVSLAQGQYVFVVDGTGPSPAAPSGIWSITQALTVTGAMVADFALPVARLDGTVTDDAGTPVAGAEVTASSSTFLDTSSQAGSGTATTGADGHYEMTLMVGTGRAVFRPPVGARLGAHVEETLTVTGDTTLDVVLAVLPPASRLTGTLRGAGGVPVAGADVAAVANGGFDVFARTQTDAAGTYEVAVPDGQYGLSFASNAAVPGLPRQWSFQRDGVTVAGDTVFDLDLPVVHVRGTVTGSDGAPLAGVSAEAHNGFFTSAISGGSFDVGVTGADGLYDLAMLAGTTTIAFTPPAGSGLAVHGVGGLALGDDTTLDVPLGVGVRVGGAVRLAGGAPLPGAKVTAVDVNVGFVVARATADDTGVYALAVEPGRFTLIAESGAAVPNAPDTWSIFENGIEVTGETAHDFELAVARLTGRVVDSNGAGVPGVTLEGSSNLVGGTGSAFANSAATTGPDGAYALVLGPDTAKLSIRPPAAFPLTVLGNLALTGDRELSVVLVTPPAGPEAALQALAAAVEALPRGVSRPLAAVVQQIDDTVARGEQALAAGDARRARNAFCLARTELATLAAVLNALPPRLLPRATASDVAALARTADTRIADRMRDAGLLACGR